MEASLYSLISGGSLQPALRFDAYYISGDFIKIIKLVFVGNSLTIHNDRPPFIMNWIAVHT